MGKVGIRGIRLNLATAGITDPAAARQRFDAAVARVRNRNAGTFRSIPSPRSSPRSATSSWHRRCRWSSIISEVRARRARYRAAWFRRSGQPCEVRKGLREDLRRCRLLSTKDDLSDVAPFAQALVAANAQRILWGTNWPHPSSTPPPGRKPTDLAVHVQTDDGKVLNMLPAWVPDAATRKLILVDNPARLYGFCTAVLEDRLRGSPSVGGTPIPLSDGTGFP